MSTKSTRKSAKRKTYNSKTWRNIRTIRLNEDPLCYLCNLQGQIRPATVVDHIITFNEDTAGTLGMDYNNTCSLCKVCHDRVTAKENILYPYLIKECNTRGIDINNLTTNDRETLCKLKYQKYLSISPVAVGVDGYPLRNY